MRFLAALGIAAAAIAAAPAADPPDLRGVWTFSTLTPLERPADLAAQPFFTDEQARAFEEQTIGRGDRDRRDGGAAVDVGRAVNDYWFDRGTRVAVVDGRKPTSLVIDPPDGRVPALTPQARAAAAARNADAREHPADGPENRSLQERCLAFNAGPPLQSGPYNNFVEIIQFKDHVILFSEMIHDARIIPLDGRPHARPAIRRWLGDSRAHWDGQTLVIDTTNFNGKAGFRGTDDNLHLVERLTRVSTDTINYEFTVDDPTVFTTPWTAVMPLTRTTDRLFEYACHEGNYALQDILRGARFEERSKP